MTIALTSSEHAEEFAYTSVEIIDAEQHSSAVSECEHSYVQVESGPYRGQLAGLRLGSVHILRDRVFNPIGYVGPSWTGSHIFSCFLPSVGTAYCYGRQVNANAVVKYPRGFSHRTSCNGPIDCVAVSVQEDAWEEESATLAGMEITRAALQRALCVPHPELVARFRRGVVGMLEQVAAMPYLVENAEWRRAAKQEWIQLLMEVVQLATTDGEKLPPPSTRAYIVDKATEYMHANLEALPVLSDICRQIHVSPRTLRYSFQEIVGVSPAHYLLSLRLRRVRRILLEGGGVRGIHRIAQQYHFWHMGRFALFYQRAFGERPSETCRRAAVSLSGMHPRLEARSAGRASKTLP